MACSHTATCPLFPLISVNSALKVWKTFYCEGKYDNCARYNLSKSGQSVPVNLLPNGKSLSMTGMATEDLSEAKAKSAAVERAAPQIIEEMASIELDDEVATPVAEVAAKPATKKTAAVKPAATEGVNGDTSSWYVRLAANTDTGVVGSVIQAFGQQRIKIDAMSEKRQSGSDIAVVLIVLTDQTTEESLNTALGELKSLPTIVGPVKKIRLEHLNPGMFS
jgi:hypothetical protein